MLSQHHLLEKDYFFFSNLNYKCLLSKIKWSYLQVCLWTSIPLTCVFASQSCPSLPCPCFDHTGDLWNPWPGIEPRILAMESWSTNHWTAREFQTISWLLLLYNCHKIQYCGFSNLISFYNVFLVIVVLLLYHLMFKNELYL